MKIDYALILAAGAGTRMGKIGQKLPKVIWPVFEKRVLELEVLYAKKLGAKRIFINLHHYKEKIQEFIDSSPIFEDVEILVEKEKIDIGGAIHNLAAHVNYKGSLLILNCDQFIFMDQAFWKKAHETFEKNDHLLFAHEVNSNQLYNGLEINNGQLVSVIPNQEIERDKQILTYTGMAFINLSKLNPAQGPSKFFDTVANPRNSNTFCFNILQSPYWDFGTLKRYWDSCFKILENIRNGKMDLFGQFLLENEAFNHEKITESGYASKGDAVINLTGFKHEKGRNKILLKGNSFAALSGEQREILYENLRAQI